MFEIIEPEVIVVKQVSKQTTLQEISFLDSIVTNRNTDHPRKVAGKINALEGYIRSAEKRVRWDMIDSSVVVSHAYRLLDGLRIAAE